MCIYRTKMFFLVIHLLILKRESCYDFHKSYLKMETVLKTSLDLVIHSRLFWEDNKSEKIENVSSEYLKMWFGK